MQIVSSWTSFGGKLDVLDHDSALLRCSMRFAVFTPPQAADGPVPVIWYLSGLTCDWSNVMEKAGLQQYAARHGVMVVAPDTSPRGDDVPDSPDYDLGQGAGFYLSATQVPWSLHYRMDRYIVEELQTIIVRDFPSDPERQGIMGHSMGGHGALTLHLKHPQIYRSVSAFSPIVSPGSVPWGKKAFGAYLGPEPSTWDEYDATKLVAKQPSAAEILIDTGDADPFLHEQLAPASFQQTCHDHGQKLNYRMQPGYDHSYYFVASLIGDHIAHHAAALG